MLSRKRSLREARLSRFALVAIRQELFGTHARDGAVRSHNAKRSHAASRSSFCISTRCWGPVVARAGHELNVEDGFASTIVRLYHFVVSQSVRTCRGLVTLCVLM